MAKDEKKASDDTASASPPAAVTTPKPVAPPVQIAAPVATTPAPALAEVVAKPAIVQLETPAPANGKRAYKVWAYGTLQRNGTIHQPGDVLNMTPEEAAKIPCLEPIA